MKSIKIFFLATVAIVAGVRGRTKTPKGIKEMKRL